MDNIPSIRMQNVVATFNLGVDQIDLKRLALSTLFVEYNPKKFAAATCRIVYPRTTALIFGWFVYGPRKSVPDSKVDQEVLRMKGE